MNNETNNKKSSTTKYLTLVGLVVIIIIISWLSIKLVNVAPSAFSSLASLAEVLNQSGLTEENEVADITVTSNKTLVNTNEAVVLSWDTARVQGTYTFSYSCTGGVSIDIIDTENGQRSISCETNYNIGNIDSLTILVESEKKRFETIDYAISFLASNDTEPRATGNASFTVINSDIQDMLSSETEEDASPEISEIENTEETIITPTETETVPTYEQEFVYTIPTSDPNGKTDLSASFLSTGNITANSYFAGVVKQDDSGAIQFEVKNYGTKTSKKWNYTVSLPSGGSYTADDQEPLKPNERAIITIGFPTSDISRYAFVVRIEESTDKNILNNQFTQVVNFVE